MENNKKMGVDSASSTPSFWQKTRQFLYTTLNAMTFGIFGTIVVGAIVQTLGLVFGIDVLSTRVSTVLTQLLGMGIGLSVGLSLKLNGLKLVMLSVAGGIAGLVRVNFNLPGWFEPTAISNNPITIYLVVVATYLIIELIFKKKTVYDLFFIPLIGVFAAVASVYIVSWPIDRLMEAIYATIRFFMQAEPYTTSAFVGLIFGILLTLPFISSAGVAIAVFSVPFGVGGGVPDSFAIAAMCAAVVGCTAQMIGFSVQTIRKNDIGTIFTVGLASSMFQFKNVMKKPMTWAPTLIASFVLPPVAFALFNGYDWFIDVINQGHTFTAAWPGMGSSGLVGQIQTLTIAGFTTEAWLFVAYQIIVPAILVLLLDVLFIRLKWYGELDLLLDTTL